MAGWEDRCGRSLPVRCRSYVESGKNLSRILVLGEILGIAEAGLQQFEQHQVLASPSRRWVDPSAHPAAILKSFGSSRGVLRSSLPSSGPLWRLLPAWRLADT